MMGTMAEPLAEQRLPQHWEAVTRFGTAVWQARHWRLTTAARFLEESLRHEPHAAPVRRELARIYEQLEQVPAAIRHLQAVLADKPDDRMAANHLARLLQELGLADEVVEVARQGLQGEIPPSEWATAVGLARRWAEAATTGREKEQAWRKVLHWTVQRRAEGLQAAVWTPRSVDREAAQAWEALSRLWIEQGRTTEAEQAWTAAERLYRRWEDEDGLLRLHAVRAEAAAQQKRWAEAVQQQRRYVEAARPDDVLSYRRYIHWMQQLGHSPEAVTAELQRLYEQSGSSPVVGVVLAVEWGRRSSTQHQAEQLAERLLQQGADVVVLQELLRGWIEQGRGLTVLRWLEHLVAAGRTVPEPAAVVTLERAQLLLRALLAEPNIAAQWLQQVRRASPSAEAAFFLGHLAAQMGQWSLADHFYHQAVERIAAPQRDAVLLRWLEVLQRLQRWEQVAEVCQRRVQQGPTAGSHVFLWQQAQALVRLGQREKAELLAQQAHQQTPAAERIAACLQQVRLLAGMGRTAIALQHLDTVRTETLRAPERQAVEVARAQLLQHQGNRPAALAAWQTVLRQDPDHLVACRELALLLTEEAEGDLSQAERLARHARYVGCWQRRLMRQSPLLDPLTTAVLARVLFRQQRVSAARQLLETAVALPEGKTDPRIWLWLAEVYESLGESQKAATARQRSQTEIPPR
jgi:tetratricopeptide (TPR) repeat protein